MLPFFIYILKCSDGSYYTGHTDNIESRISAHKLGQGCTYTKERLPIEVVFVQQFGSRYEALSAEQQIKGWNRRKKEALMRGDWSDLIRLAQIRRPDSESSEHIK